MATEVKVKPGTAISWTPGGGNSLTLTSLATVSARVGSQVDLGATFGRFARWRLKTKFAVAPVAGTLLEVYLVTSNNTLRDGVAGAVDAALTAASRFQCQLIGSMYCQATTNSQETSGVVMLTSRYVSPAIYNATGQSLSGSAGDHEFVLEPYIDEVQ